MAALSAAGSAEAAGHTSQPLDAWASMGGKSDSSRRPVSEAAAAASKPESLFGHADARALLFSKKHAHQLQESRGRRQHRGSQSYRNYYHLFMAYSLVLLFAILLIVFCFTSINDRMDLVEIAFWLVPLTLSCSIILYLAFVLGISLLLIQTQHWHRCISLQQVAGSLGKYQQQQLSRCIQRVETDLKASAMRHIKVASQNFGGHNADTGGHNADSCGHNADTGGHNADTGGHTIAVEMHLLRPKTPQCDSEQSD